MTIQAKRRSTRRRCSSRKMRRRWAGFSRGGRDVSPMKSKTEQREYQRRWMRARRDRWLQENGPCRRCGSEESLEVDHIDPQTKVTHAVWSWSKARRDRELAKCQVLCKVCHKAKSDAAMRVHSPCGTRQSYNKGCRCPNCRSAHAQYHRQRRKLVTRYRTRSVVPQRDFFGRDGEVA